MIGASMAVRPPKTRGLAQMAIDAIRRAGGTVLAAGAATPVLGPELCTDGGFNVGVADWTAAGGVHTWTGSALRRAIGQGNAGSYRDFTVTPNAEYLVGGAILNAVGSGGLAMNIYGGGGFTGLLASLLATGYAFVRPTTSTLRIYFYTDNTRGADLDDVTVRLFSGYTYGNPPTRNYFDSAGTDILDSVTQVDQPVGLTLDGAGAVGPNLVTNGDFANGVDGWTVPAGWGLASGAMVATATSSSMVQQAAVSIPGSSYEVEFDWTHTGGTLYVRVGAGTAATFATSGRKRVTLVAVSTAGIEFYGGSVSGELDNIVSRRLTGNHATQPTTGSKPTLRRGLVNQLTQSDFQNGVTDAPTRGGLVTASTLAGYGGALAFGHDGSTLSYAYKGLAVTAGVAYTVAVVVKMDDGNVPTFGHSDIANNLNSFALVNQADGINPQTYSVVAQSDGTYIVCATYTKATAGSNFGVFKYATNNNRTFKVTRYGLFTGTVTAQQILAAGGIPLTTTAPASSALGNYWWQFSPDAPGDFLQTAITTGNEGWVCVGVTPGVTATGHHIFGNGATGAADVGVWVRIPSTNNNVTLLASNGTTREIVVASTSAFTGAPVVVDGGWTASIAIAAVNGVETSIAKTVNCTTTKSCTIGGNASSGWYLNGAMSATVICPTLPPPADRALIRAWVAKQQGQTL